MLTLTRDPRGTLGDEGNKKKQQTNTFCSNLLQDVIEVPASFQRHSAPPQTNNLHYQDTPGWGSHSLKLRKAQQWKETTIHCPGGRASSAVSAQVCQGHVREPGHQVKIPPPSQMYPLAYPRPLVEVTKLLDSLGLPLALHSGNQGFCNIPPLNVPLSRHSQRNYLVQNNIFLPTPP